MSAIALDDYRWLTSCEATRYLEGVAESTAPVLKQAVSLRRDLSPERTHLVLEQVELRRKAREKFPFAERMFFTRKGLEQATDHAIATYKAHSFRDGDGVDLCCGIGGDLLALGTNGNHVTGVDLDSVTAHLAAANCQAANLTRARVFVGKAEDHPPGREMWWHLDPDRRMQQPRASQIENYTPGAEFWQSLLERVNHGVIKLAPAAKVSEAIAQENCREWVETRGECRQQIVWHKAWHGIEGRRSARVLNHLGFTVGSVWGSDNPKMTAANRVLRYIYEPRPCVFAAGLVSTLARSSRMSALAKGSVYLTCDKQYESPMMSKFEVLLVVPYDLKQLKAIVKERRLGRLEVKCRGVDVDPEKVRKELKTKGDEQATLILVSLPEGMRAILALRRPFQADALV